MGPYFTSENLMTAKFVMAYVLEMIKPFQVNVRLMVTLVMYIRLWLKNQYFGL